MDFTFSKSVDFLRSRLRQMPKNGYGEARRMAKHLRVSSTFMSQVLSGSKLLSPEQAIQLCRYFGLAATEAEYFLLLVQTDRAGHADLKTYYRQKIDSLAKESLKLAGRLDAKKKLSEEEKAVFYSHPIFSAVHVYCSTGKTGRSAEEIAGRFALPRARATEIVRFLLAANLLQQTGERFRTGSQGTHLEQGSPYLLRHHTNWRLRAVQAAEDLGDKELMYTVNVSLSEKDFAVLREEMVEFIKSFLARVYPSESEVIACLNMDWFLIRK